MSSPRIIFDPFAGVDLIGGSTSSSGVAGSFSEIGSGNGTGYYSCQALCRSHDLEVVVTAKNGVKLFINASGYNTSDGVIFEMKTVNSQNMISLSLISSDITSSNDNLTVHKNELPWPSNFTFNASQQFKLSTGTYGYRVSIKSGSRWVPIIEIPFKNPAVNYSGSAVASKMKSDVSSYCGVIFAPLTTCSLFKVYSVPEYCNAPANNAFGRYIAFKDTFNRTSNPYNPNSGDPGSSLNGMYSAGSNLSNFTTDGSYLSFSTSTPSELITKGTNTVYQPLDIECPVTMISFIYIQGKPVLEFGTTPPFQIFFNSTRDGGSTRPVTVGTYISTFDSKSGNTTFSYTYDSVGSAPGTPTKANTAGTTLSSGDRVWVVLYPRVTSATYPPQDVEYKVGIYIKSSDPVYTDVPILRTTIAFPSKSFNMIRLSDDAGTTSKIDDLEISFKSLLSFGNPVSSTVNTTTSFNYGVPVSQPESISTPFETQSSQLVAACYLGNDLVYNTSEVMS